MKVARSLRPVSWPRPRLSLAVLGLALAACDPASRDADTELITQEAITPAKLAVSAVVASADDGNVPANTIDGSLATRWSASGDGQWIQYDLGTNKTVSLLKIAFFKGNERVSIFDILTATSSSGPWNTVQAGVRSSGTTLSLQTFDFTDVAQARYVRLVGHGNTSATSGQWNSLTEVEVWGGTPETNVVATPTFNPGAGTYTGTQSVTISTTSAGASIRYTTDGTTNPTPTTGTLYSGPVSVSTSTTLKAVAYASGMTTSAVATAAYTINTGTTNTEFTIPGSAVTASTSDGNVPANTVDGNLGTRWSANNDNQWIRYDLGGNRRVGFVKIAFYNGDTRIYRFDLQTSTDGVTWSTARAGVTSTKTLSLQTFDFPDVDPARYVRYLGHSNDVNTWNSLTELEVWGGPSSGNCSAETDAAFCTRLAKNCGSVTGQDNCGRTRTVASCGTCTAPQTCGGGGVGNVCGGGTVPGTTPVARNGLLRVCGRQICNQNNKAIQLRGMSTHGLQWYGWNKCITKESLKALAETWGADIVRMSLYVQEGGYETNPSAFRTQIANIVAQVLELGIYAIVDWHMLTPGDPNANLTLAKEYFTWFTMNYGHHPNFLYEIANEPNGVSWSTIKSYANQMIPVVRAKAPNGIIIIGTRGWSSFGVSDGSGPDEVINNPVAGTNLMYTFHFYAASHGSSYRSALIKAADNLPVFVTEWGTQLASGDGGNDFTSSQQYIDIMAQKKISWVNWNYSDDFRSGAVFKTGTCANLGPWTGTSLKPAGVWVQGKIQNPPDDF
jgi:endoglucanase